MVAGRKMFDQTFCSSLERVSDLINASLHTSVLNQGGEGLTEAGNCLLQSLVIVVNGDL